MRLLREPEENQHERDQDNSTIADEPCNSPMLLPLAGTAYCFNEGYPWM